MPRDQNVHTAKPVRPSTTSAPLHRTDAFSASGGPRCFVGRQAELAELLRALRDADRGSGGVALLEGEPGIGKTRTAEEFAARARSCGAAVFWGRCFEGEECPPYGPWIAALRSHVLPVDAQVLRQMMGEGAADIAEILPELPKKLGDLNPPVRLPAADGERRLFSSLISFLIRAAQAVPLVIIMDNLHLADAGSLKLLRHVASELAESRLMILVTCRYPTEGRPDPLALTLEELEKTRGFCRLHLEGLSRDEVLEFLAASLPVDRPSLAETIHARTEGNPLFIVELARHILHAPPREDPAQSLPEGIRQAIDRRLARLSEACRETLRTAAVLGRSFDHEVLLRMGDDPGHGATARALEEANAAAIVWLEDPAAARYRFVHALVQETILDGIPATGRTALHLRAAKAIRQACGPEPGPRWVEIARHLLECAGAAEPDDLLRSALQAADYAAKRYAVEQALAIVDRTREAWERLGRTVDARMAPLLHLRGRMLTDLQKPEEAHESLVRAFDLHLRAGDHRSAIEVARTPAMERAGATWYMSVAGTGSGVNELRERALALAPVDSADRAWLLMQHGSRAEILQALSFAERTGDEELGAHAVSRLAYHELLAWNFEECERLLEVASQRADRLQDSWVAVNCAYTRYYLGTLTGRPGLAPEAVRQLFDLAGTTRSLRLGITADRCAADLAGMRGDWAEARRHGDRALALLTETGPVFNHCMVLRILLGVDLRTGSLKSAGRRLEALQRLTGETGSSNVRTTVLGARITGDASVLAPPPEPCEVRSSEGPLITFIATTPLRRAAVTALRRDTGAASSCLAAVRRWSGTYIEQPTDGILGSLCDLLGRRNEAVDSFDHALSFCRRAGYLPELAMTCADYAETLVRGGSPADVDHAGQLLDEGLGLCETLEMPLLEQRFRQQRELLGGSPPSRRSIADGLTPREREVLRLVARGFTNAEIGERLFISPLTVARHIHNLLEKTGTANRAEAAAYAVRNGLTDHGAAASW
jgi:DNA-binding CsgD family transcriptional regulator/tetratricopeptide (TPR) repeat protein